MVNRLELPRPHGFLLWRGKKTAVLAPGELPVGEPLEVVTGDEVFGTAVLGQPAKMLASEADRKEYFESHRVYPREREKWWPGETRFNLYPVESFEALPEIRRAFALKDAEPGRDCPACVHEGGGSCRLHDELTSGRKACPDWETFEDWRGDEVKAESSEVEDWRGGGEVMPYKVEKEDDEFCVVNAETGETVKCHPTEKEAEAHLVALRINVEAEEKGPGGGLFAEDELRQAALSDEAKGRIFDQVLKMAEDAKQAEAEKGRLKKLMQEVEDLKAELERAKAEGPTAEESLEKLAKAEQFDDSEWDGSAANWDTADAYCRDSLIDVNPEGEDKTKALCKLPYRYPGKPPNKAALRAIAGGARGIGALKKPPDVSQDKWDAQVVSAKKKLRGWWPDAFDKEPPDSLKARGEGRGVGGEPQGDGGAETCVCPSCGHEMEHEKGTPCTEVECPECGAAMQGKDAKAGRRVKRSMRKRLEDAVDALKDLLTWAKYEDGEEDKPGITYVDLFKDSEAGFAIKTVNGEPWLLTWSSNAFIDRDEEIFTTKGLEEYVLENETKEDRGHFNFWHVPGTDFAEKRWQGVIGRFLVEAGPFADDARGRAAKEFFTEHSGGHPKVAPEGWGSSVEYRYLPEEKQSGVYEKFWVTRTSVLPRLAAANTRTKGGVRMALTKKQKQGLQEIFPDEAESIIEEAEQETKKLEEAGVEHKAAESEDEKAMDAKAIAKAIRKLAGDADEELAGRLEKLAKALLDEKEEEAEKAPVPEYGIEELAAEMVKHFDVQLEPVNELAQAVEALQADVAKVLRAEKTRQDENLPRAVLTWEKRASQAEETELAEDDPLAKMKPAETKPDASGSGANHFFPRKK